jgi:nucleoside-diphosphate-sugar epimerase
MTPHQLVVFGLGYTATFLAQELIAQGVRVIGTRRRLDSLALDGSVPAGVVLLAFDDADAVAKACAGATHILSSIPPDSQGDPVLRSYAHALTAPWLGYLSSTAVYGDTGGAWVDETHATVLGERPERTRADRAWQALGAHTFRLSGIYGPGRSALERVQAGTAQRIDKPGHVFCRIHVADSIAAIQASMRAPARGGAVYNVSDDLPAPGPEPIDYACQLLGIAPPPLIPYAQAVLSPMAQTFYAGSRRVRNDKIKQDLRLVLRYPTYRHGLQALYESTLKV